MNAEGTAMKIGVIGLGSMGMGAALNLVRKGHEVTGCELRETARDELAKAAARRWPSRPRCRPTWTR
jgi:3-hydroxyisobutyrate dehydrogenase-like beta-hydroxyacid dehydrogenase